MTTLRVVHYLNQFFAGIGAEDKADTPPGRREGALGPGRLLQQALGERRGSSPRSTAATTTRVRSAGARRHHRSHRRRSAGHRHRRPGLLGRALRGWLRRDRGARARAARRHRRDRDALDNAAAELYRTKVYVAGSKRRRRDGGGARAMARAGAEARKPASHSARRVTKAICRPGAACSRMASRTAGERAIDMLLRKVRGEPTRRSGPCRATPVSTPAPPSETSQATIALVTTGGLVPRGNPDRLESGYATKWLRYSIKGLDELTPERWQSVHGGFDTTLINLDPHRRGAARRRARARSVRGHRTPFDELFVTTGNTSVIPDIRRFAARWRGAEGRRRRRGDPHQYLRLVQPRRRRGSEGDRGARNSGRSGQRARRAREVVGSNRIVRGKAITSVVGDPA